LSGLLGGLLGGSTKIGTSSNGGDLLGGLLGPSGILGGLLGGANSPLKLLLDPKSGLLAGLLGGPNGNLLKGLFDGKNGVVGAVTGVINQVLCLLENHGLGIVLQLLKLVPLDSILGLNQVCQADGGNDLLSLLFKNVLSLPLVNNIVCLTNSLGLQPVLQLVENIGMGKLIGLSKISCSGVPLISPNSTASNILSQLLGSLDVKIILSSSVGALANLATELDLANVLDVQKFVPQLLCLLQNGLKLDGVVKLIQKLGVDVLLNITNTNCKDGKPLFSDLIKASGLSLEKLLGQLGCLLNVAGLGPVEQLLGELKLSVLGALNSMCSARGVDGLLGSLLQGGLGALKPLICLLKSLPVVGDVVKLVEKLGLEKLLLVGNLTCESGSSALDLSSVLDVVTNLASSLNLDVLAGLNLTNILDLKLILDPLNGVLDLPGLLNSVACLVEHLGLKVVIDFLKQVGVTKAIGLNVELCTAVNGTSGSGVLSVLLNGLGENLLFDLFNTLGVSQLLQLADFIIQDGKLLGLDLLDNLLCIVASAGLQPVIDLLKKVGLDKLLGILDFFCLNGKPIRLNHTLDIFAEAIIRCEATDSVECTS
ncbi:unnamed protein product, partial [Lymnaea stagnalis]